MENEVFGLAKSEMGGVNNTYDLVKNETGSVVVKLEGGDNKELPMTETASSALSF